ncbi:MAG: GntR family transcriptional regulator [Eubacterium sp.]|nr:GntR family transcriptional regulator [Eubacterium sp.]
MIVIQKNAPKPLYLQLEELIRNNIDNGVWKHQNAIPSESELQKEYGLSRMTVRTACQNLVQEGILYRVPGKGTFVAEPKIMTDSLAYMGFREQLERMGYATTTELLESKIIQASASVSKKLRIPENASVMYIERMRYLKKKPISLHHSYIPIQLCEGIEKHDLINEQLCVIMEKEYQLRPHKIQETLESVRASKKESQLFGVAEDYPLLILEDNLFDQNDVPYEYSKVVFRGDKIKLRYEFHNL